MNAFMYGLFAGLALNTPEGRKLLSLMESKAMKSINSFKDNVKDIIKASEIPEEKDDNEKQ